MSVHTWTRNTKRYPKNENQYRHHGYEIGHMRGKEERRNWFSVYSVIVHDTANIETRDEKMHEVKDEEIVWGRQRRAKDYADTWI